MKACKRGFKGRVTSSRVRAIDIRESKPGKIRNWTMANLKSEIRSHPKYQIGRLENKRRRWSDLIFRVSDLRFASGRAALLTQGINLTYETPALHPGCREAGHSYADQGVSLARLAHPPGYVPCTAPWCIEGQAARSWSRCARARRRSFRRRSILPPRSARRVRCY